MADPVVVEVTRGGLVESRHRAAVAIVDAEGRTMFGIGDVDRPIYPRSAIKPLQALALVETGAADAFGYGARELALAQASHGGEPGHVALAAAMLKAAGLEPSTLACGAHPPSHAPAAAALARASQAATALHNNCSGKHAGFLAVASRLGLPSGGYVTAGHPVQAIVRETLAAATGAPHRPEACGTDGCSIPTYPVPLTALARGFARFATGVGLSDGRAAAARRLYEAAVAEPWFLAGSGRFCSEVVAALNGAALVKTGAEGVFCGAVPSLGVGIALKCDDGAARAAECAMAAVLARLLPEQADALAAWTDRPLTNWNGISVGGVRAVGEALAGLGPPP
ncbi:MAG TPA: asparaginase [Afifellaceae bacterium]|nr:asparaginase [Afifellaceae bacterium]